MLEALERTLRQAGELALTESLSVETKGKSDFVTSTDLAIDRYRGWCRAAACSARKRRTAAT